MGHEQLTDVIPTRVSHFNQKNFQVWDYTCFEMVINDNEHMNNHSAIFRPVSAKTANSVKNGQKQQLEIKLLKTNEKWPK